MASAGLKRTDSGGYEVFLEYKKPSIMTGVELVATLGSILLLITTLPFSLFWCFKVVQEYERAVIFRLGRVRAGGARGPGIFFILPCLDSYVKVDLRTISFDVPPQEVEALTKDSVTVTVDAVVYYRIQDPLNAVVKVTNYSNSTRLLAMTTLRNILGTRSLAEILSDREAISHAMQTSLDVATDPWGVKVERVEMFVPTKPNDAYMNVRFMRITKFVPTSSDNSTTDKDVFQQNLDTFMSVSTNDHFHQRLGCRTVRPNCHVLSKDVSLPQQLQRAMAAEAEASREARAKVIAAEGEMKASRALKEASDVINESPVALQLRYLQTLNNISAEKNSTIVFPLPIDLISFFIDSKYNLRHTNNDRPKHTQQENTLFK